MILAVAKIFEKSNTDNQFCKYRNDNDLSQKLQIRLRSPVR